MSDVSDRALEAVLHIYVYYIQRERESIMCIKVTEEYFIMVFFFFTNFIFSV